MTAKKKAAKQLTQMDELTKNYEQFIKGKETVANGKDVFDKAIEKAAKPKPRGSK